MGLTVAEAALLGLVQGLTEFLPVSSSGHLVLVQRWLGVDPPGLTLEVAVHLGTLLAVLAVYGRDVAALARGAWDLVRGGPRAAAEPGPARLALAVLLGTLPAAAVALLAGDAVAAAFDRRGLLGGAFLLTSALLALAQRAARRPARVRDEAGLLPRHALWVGTLQALAILPGVSRSGSTIAAGVLAGMTPDLAARFSFLLSVPAVLGAAVLDALGAVGRGAPAPAPLPLLVATAVAAVSGYAALLLLLRLLDRRRLLPFAAYTALLGLVALLTRA